MKIGRIVLLSAVAGLLLFNVSAQAADTPARDPQARMAERNKAMFEKLGINDQQKEKLTAILAEEGKQMREVMGKTDLAAADRRTEMTKIREATLKKVTDAKILTDEQLTKFKELRAAPARGGRRPAAQ